MNFPGTLTVLFKVYAALNFTARTGRNLQHHVCSHRGGRSEKLLWRLAPANLAGIDVHPEIALVAATLLKMNSERDEKYSSFTTEVKKQLLITHLAAA